MTTSRDKLSLDDIELLHTLLHEDLSIAFGDEIDSTSSAIIPSALYIFSGENYDSADHTWFLDWKNGRWHVSYQTRTHDYRDGRLEQILKTINWNYQAVSVS